MKVNIKTKIKYILRSCSACNWAHAYQWRIFVLTVLTIEPLRHASHSGPISRFKGPFARTSTGP